MKRQEYEEPRLKYIQMDNISETLTVNYDDEKDKIRMQP